MHVRVNGRSTDIGRGSVLGDVLKDQPYTPGSKIAVIRSEELIKKETREFEIRFSKGSMILRLNESEYGRLMRTSIENLKGLVIRWQTSKIVAAGSFATEIEVDRGRYRYRKYDCFFALGGFDPSTTYIMVAKTDHEGQYGVRRGVFGRIIRGRYLLDELEEGDRILDVQPVILEMKDRDAFLTDDINLPLEEGMTIETYVHVKLDPESPMSSEHFLVLSEKGVMRITDSTRTFGACSENLDVVLPPEKMAVRERWSVTVRNKGTGMGRVYFYRTQRQLHPSHTHAGMVVTGRELIRLVGADDLITVTTDPPRILTIGMTQAEGQNLLETFGKVQVRKGDVSDDAVIVEQEPELTMQLLQTDRVETFGVKSDRIHEIELWPDLSPKTYRYFRRMTGLDHKPIGTLKVFFTYPGMSMIIFEGSSKEASGLPPEETFGEFSVKGQIGVTNQARPQKGLIGIRLEDSQEFGPTGEERYGTNIVGRIVSDLDGLVEGLKDGDIVYIKEVKKDEQYDR